MCPVASLTLYFKYFTCARKRRQKCTFFSALSSSCKASVRDGKPWSRRLMNNCLWGVVTTRKCGPLTNTLGLGLICPVYFPEWDTTDLCRFQRRLSWMGTGVCVLLGSSSLKFLRGVEVEAPWRKTLEGHFFPGIQVETSAGLLRTIGPVGTVGSSNWHPLYASNIWSKENFESHGVFYLFLHSRMQMKWNVVKFEDTKYC